MTVEALLSNVGCDWPGDYSFTTKVKTMGLAGGFLLTKRIMELLVDVNFV